jgi:hypothetical protein
LKKVLIAVVIVLVATALYFYNFDKNYRNLLGKPSEPLGNFSPAFKVTGLPFLSYITRS